MSKKISYQEQVSNNKLSSYVDEVFGFETYEEDEEKKEKDLIEDLGDYNYFKYKEED